MHKFDEQLKKSLKLKVSNKSKFTPQKGTVSAQSLSVVERKEKGMEYLELAKKLKDKEKERQRRHTQLPPKVEPYRDYMKELRVKEYETEEQVFKSIIRRGRSVSDY